MLRQFEKDNIAYLVSKYFDKAQINMIEEAVAQIIADIDWEIFEHEGRDYEKICRRENCWVSEDNPIIQEVEKRVLNRVITWAELRLKEVEK